MPAYRRIVAVEDLPHSLWSNDTLHVAPELAKAYVDRVHACGLGAVARNRDSNSPPVGGPTPQAADEHFAQAFAASAARTALALLDPRVDVAHIADALAVACAGGKLVILDVPSGAGAFSLSVLCCIAELRAMNTIPRQPLDVVVVGGEFNSHATAHASALFGSVSKGLAAQAVHVVFKHLAWDVCNKLSTTDLLKRYVADADTAEQRLVGVSNFSGFLMQASKQKTAEPQLEEIFRYCRDANSTLVWLEPQTNAARASLFGWLRAFVRRQLGSVAEFVGLGGAPDDDEYDVPSTEAAFALPLEPGRLATVRLSVLRYNLWRPLA